MTINYTITNTRSLTRNMDRFCQSLKPIYNNTEISTLKIYLAVGFKSNFIYISKFVLNIFFYIVEGLSQQSNSVFFLDKVDSTLRHRLYARTGLLLVDMSGSDGTMRCCVDVLSVCLASN